MSEEKSSLKMAEVVRDMTDLVNCMGSERYLTLAFSEAMHRQHRTLQADLVTVLLKGLLEWASDCDTHNLMDARNEIAVKTVIETLGSAENLVCRTY